ncbi:pilus assembly protein [Chitinimonas koreensis]|uniref:pilus assembly protein n=1 Tax=Chitinimonas koreensis TaxID=356302 RepID=UPI00040E2782|nr:PilC/PilY family type IV pilus protein [Chitinimonas koreensis]QNM95274.1 hypothetical protein H9L41_15495 [Chitinimonas koreensis]
MRKRFQIKPLCNWVCLVLATYPAAGALAAEPYPALPPTLSTAVTPNIMLFIDNSGSMADPPKAGEAKKIETARKVATNLVSDPANRKLRWGLFSFHPQENAKAGILQSAIKERTGDAELKELTDKIAGLNPDTWTPLAEATYEMSRYWRGMDSFYWKNTSYTSPIQYRCQKNFQIIITDGEPTQDDTFASDTQDPTRKGYSNALNGMTRHAFEQDLRDTTALDLDKKSFNDTRFPQQNVSSYTVGFAVDYPLLKLAAEEAGGKYFTATGEKELSDSLNNAVASIVSSTSNAGGVAVQSDVLTAGNYVYQPVFNPSDWHGELRRYGLSANGTIDFASKLDANAVLNARKTARSIYTSKVIKGVSSSFTFDDTNGLVAMTATQKSLLGADDTERKKVINYLRGTDQTGMRKRTNKLGDIVDAQPSVVGKPLGYTTDPDYPAFQTIHANRSMVFIGANDGMLHGFAWSDMSELFGYIPAAVYPHLKDLTKTTYGQAGTPHTYHVNGQTRQEDVKIGDNWTTMLVGGLGQGGQGYFAIDATRADNFARAADTVKWEWNDQSDSSVGYTFATPLIYNVRISENEVKPAAILANGYNNDYDDSAVGGSKNASRTSALYLVDVATGVPIKTFVLPAGSTGLSSPAGVDYGQDGILDLIYVGDENGNLWRFDVTDNGAYKIEPKLIFTAPANQPIVMRPAIVPITESTKGTPVGNMVLFGTGRLLTEADRGDTNQQALYGVLDKLEENPKVITQASLVEQTVTGTATVSTPGMRAGNYRKVSENALEVTSEKETKLGWYMNLPVSTERLVASPLAFNDKVIFSTGITSSSEKCLPGGKGWIMGLNPLTGSVTMDARRKVPYSFLDLNLDNKASSADQIPFSGTNSYVSGYEMDGIPTESAFAAKSLKVTAPAVDDSGLGNAGAVIALREANAMGVYTAYGPNGTKTGKPIKRPNPDGAGLFANGTLGKDDLSTANLVSPSSGVKIERVTWREIVQ